MSSDSGSSVKPDGDIQSQQAAATTLVSTLVTGVYVLYVRKVSVPT